TRPTTSYRVTLDPGDAPGGRDWGLQQPVTINGTVFRDVNRDGKMSGDAETPLSGWRVYLDMNNDAKPATDGSEPIIDTGEKGTFEFTNLRPGTYKLRVVSQSGWVYTDGTGGSAITITQTNSGGASKHDFAISAGRISG